MPRSGRVGDVALYRRVLEQARPAEQSLLFARDGGEDQRRPVMSGRLPR